LFSLRGVLLYRAVHHRHVRLLSGLSGPLSLLRHHAVLLLVLVLLVRVPLHVSPVALVPVASVAVRVGLRLSPGRHRRSRRHRPRIGPHPAVLLAPEALHHVAVYLGVVDRLDGVRRRLFGCEFYEGVAFVLEDSDVLDDSELRERLLHQLLGQAVGEAAAVHRAVGRRALVVDLRETRRFKSAPFKIMRKKDIL
jgi:hypothetical protein